MKALFSTPFTTTLCLFLSGCTSEIADLPATNRATPLAFGPEIAIGESKANPSAPFLRYAPDGRLFAVWTEDNEIPGVRGKHSGASAHMKSESDPSPMRNAFLTSSSDNGKTWSPRRRVNTEIEAVQGEENGPKIAFGPDSRPYVVWSIPGVKGDKTRANIRFAMEDGRGGFTPARTLNEVKDAARFPIIEASPAGYFFIAWIDRRIDNPKPRQLYLMKIGADGQALTKNYQAGEALCECCKLGLAFGENENTVYIVSRQVDSNMVRDHVLRKSSDGGTTFNSPLEISQDGWRVPACPHSGPSIGRDQRGWLHVTWFTLGRSEADAGIYYSLSKDNGRTFAPRRLVHANTAPEILYNNLIVGDDNRIYLAWNNLDATGRAQIFMRTLAADGQAWSPIQQISKAKGNASRPVLAFHKGRLHIAWSETDGEDSRVVLRTAAVNP